MQAHFRREKTFAADTLPWLVALGALLVLALHLIERDFDPLRRFLSEYALGPLGALMNATFFLVAASGAALARGAYRAHRWLVAAGFSGWTLGLAVCGVCITDSTLPDQVRTWTGIAHDLGADVAFLSVFAVMLTTPRGRLFALPMMIAFVAAHATGLIGLGQRVFVGFATAWIGTELAKARE